MIKLLLIFISLIFSISAHSEVDPFENINQVTHKINDTLDEEFA